MRRTEIELGHQFIPAKILSTNYVTFFALCTYLEANRKGNVSTAKYIWCVCLTVTITTHY